MVRTIRHRFAPGWAVAVPAIAFGFNFVWEMAVLTPTTMRLAGRAVTAQG